MSRKITPKHQRFISEYLLDLNATRAAKSAGYSHKTAYSAGQRLLKDVEISRLIAEKSKEHLDKIDISVERVLRGLGNLAFFDMRKLYHEDGKLKSVPELDYDAQAGICGVEIDKLFERFGGGQASEVGTTTKVKVADRGINLERLGRYHKLFTDKIEHSGSVSLAERIERARKAVAEKKNGV
jgi:phage terminase small subunit